VSGDGNPPPFLHLFFLFSSFFPFFFSFNNDVPVHGKAFAPLHFRSKENKKIQHKKQNKKRKKDSTLKELLCYHAVTRIGGAG
jgi:accessory gene regulator protein AgrB